MDEKNAVISTRDLIRLQRARFAAALDLARELSILGFTGAPDFLHRHCRQQLPAIRLRTRIAHTPGTAPLRRYWLPSPATSSMRFQYTWGCNQVFGSEVSRNASAIRCLSDRLTYRPHIPTLLAYRVYEGSLPPLREEGSSLSAAAQASSATFLSGPVPARNAGPERWYANCACVSDPEGCALAQRKGCPHNFSFRKISA